MVKKIKTPRPVPYAPNHVPISSPPPELRAKLFLCYDPNHYVVISHQCIPFPLPQARLNRRIIIHEPDVPRSLNIPSHKFLITGWSFILGISRQHALYAHADALNVLHGTPALSV